MKYELLLYAIIIFYILYKWYNNFPYIKKYMVAVFNIYNNPKDAAAWFEKGKAQYYLKLKGSTIYSLNISLELNDKNFFAWYYKGKTLFRLKKFEDSIQAFDKCLDIDPENSNIWHCKGKALNNLKKYKDAIYAYDKAIEINPENISAWYDKGKVLYNLKKFDEVILVFNKIDEINPENPPVWYELETGSKILDSHWFKWGRKKYINEFERLFKEKIERFEHLKSVSTEEKDRIRLKIFFAIGKIAAYEAWVAFVKRITILIKPTGFLFFLIFQIILLVVWFQAERSVFEWVLVILIIYMTLLIVEKIILLFRNIFIFVFLIMISWIFITMKFEWMPQVIHDGVGTAIVGFSALLIWVLLFYSVLALGIWLINRRKNKKYPEAVVMDSLCTTLDLIETESDKWPDIELKNKLLIELENIAKRLENELPKKISSYDAVTDIWLKDCTRKIGMGIRKLKQHVLFQNDKSQEQLIIALSNRFVNAADENWDLFEQIDTPSVPNWRLRSFYILRRLAAIIIIPLIIVFFVTIAPITLNDSIMGSIIAGYISWVAFNILAWLYPDYQNKIETFKEKADILHNRKNK